MPRFAIAHVLAILLVGGIAANAAGALSARGLDVICLVSVGWTVFKVAQIRLRRTVLGAAVALVLAGGLFVLQEIFANLRYMPYLLIVPANLALAVVFARGLLPARRPILLELIDLMARRPTDDPKFVRFVTGQCVLWSILALVTAVLAAGCLFYASTYPLLATLLTWIVVAQIVWFAVSHYYAALRYDRPEKWWETLSALARPDIRSQLVY